MDTTNITSQIGAFELGDNLESHNDGALESAGEFAGPSPVRTLPQGGCYPPTSFCISDSALETAGVTMALAPTMRVEGCR